MYVKFNNIGKLNACLKSFFRQASKDTKQRRLGFTAQLIPRTSYLLG